MRLGGLGLIALLLAAVFENLLDGIARVGVGIDWRILFRGIGLAPLARLRLTRLHLVGIRFASGRAFTLAGLPVGLAFFVLVPRLLARLWEGLCCIRFRLFVRLLARLRLGRLFLLLRRLIERWLLLLLGSLVRFRWALVGIGRRGLSTFGGRLTGRGDNLDPAAVGLAAARVWLPDVLRFGPVENAIAGLERELCWPELIFSDERSAEPRLPRRMSQQDRCSQLATARNGANAHAFQPEVGIFSLHTHGQLPIGRHSRLLFSRRYQSNFGRQIADDLNPMANRPRVDPSGRIDQS